jgi:hypothetical protein
MVTLTREELYAMVWDRPMRTLAGEFGLSDVALHKICRKHAVPTPPVGYWAKKAHGKPVKVTALPKPKGGSPSKIVIHEGAAGFESEAMSAARTLIRHRLAEAADAAQERDPIVERTLQKLEKARGDRLGLVRAEGKGRIAVAVRPESVERAGKLLDHLVSAATAAGIALDARENAAQWIVDGERIAFELIELADKVAHVATQKELAAVTTWEREREETHRRWGYWSDYGRPHIPKWDDHYRGRLAIRLEEVRVKSERNCWGQAIRRQFADRSNRAVEKDIPRIVETIAAIAVAKRENRAFEERQRREAEERERQWIIAERRRALEEKRTQLLEQLITENGEAERIRRLVTMLGQSPERPPRVEALLTWARERHARQLALLAAEALDDRLAKAGVFETVEASDAMPPASVSAFNF